MNDLFYKNRLFELLNINSKQELSVVVRRLKMSSSQLKYYNDRMICPTGEDLKKIASYMGMSEQEVQLRLGILSCDIINWITHNPNCILNAYQTESRQTQFAKAKVVFRTEYGKLYNCDCMNVFREIDNDTVDLIFADPPFNLSKQYGAGINDAVSEREYLEWTEKWLKECVRVLKPGGSIFVYNIPHWLTHIANILDRYMNFRHWIAIYMRGLMPVQNKLHPSHYGLLYYVKGEKPRVFNQQRIPMPTCRHCGGEIHDYGGKKNGLNPDGLCIADVWNDINPVRHQKYKNREANELPIKLLYRIITLASNKGDIVLDPFGGSGTTYVVAEFLKRRWIGSEIGEVKCIIERMKLRRDIENLRLVEKNSNVLFTDEQVSLRQKNGFWTYEMLDACQESVQAE